jgi:hypothetical protein
MIKKITLILTLMVTLNSCFVSSPKEIKKGMDPWIGKDINSLILKWGTPTSTFKLPSGKFTNYTWDYSSIVSSTVPNSFYQSHCRIDWTVDDKDIIVSYRHEGDCKVK